MPSKTKPADTGAVVTETAVRDRAYFLWEQAGRPDGVGDQFWHMALQEATRILVELSGSGDAGRKRSHDAPAKVGKPRKSTAKSASTTSDKAHEKAAKAHKGAAGTAEARAAKPKAAKPKATRAKEAAAPRSRGKAAAKPARKSTTKPRAAVQKPK